VIVELVIHGGEHKRCYQQLDVYQCSIQFIALATIADSQTVAGTFFLSRRAEARIDIDAAKYGRRSRETWRSRQITIARGCALESGAIFAVGAGSKLFPTCDPKIYMELLERIVSMLSKMMKLG